MPVVFYFSGLNTYGDDLLHVGPWTFGQMHARWKSELESRGFKVVVIGPFGNRPLSEQAQQADLFLKNNHEWNNTSQCHWLGHSCGGWIARNLLNPSDFSHHTKVMSLVTMATPHHGSRLAKEVLDRLGSERSLNRFLKKCGYDLTKRLTLLRELALGLSNEDPHHPATFCLQFECPYKSMSWPLLLMHNLLRFFHQGDGLVETPSQKWGTSLGVFELDHIQQLGHPFVLSPALRKKKESEFRRAVDTVASLWKDLEKGNNHQ